MPAYRIEPTPNPNSLKFSAVDGQFIPEGLKAYMSLDEAKEDPLGAALFRIEGVVDVLILPGFLTVSKRPEVDWGRILPRIEAVLDGHVG